MKEGEKGPWFLAAMAAIMVCFASNSVITRYLVLGGHVSPFNLTVTRFGSGLVMLHLLSLLPLYDRGPAGAVHIPGALFLGVYAFSISYGYYYISSAAKVLIFYTFVVATMTLYSFWYDGERPTIHQVLGQLLGLTGVLVISSGGITNVTSLGAVLMALTGASWWLYCVYGRRFQNAFEYTYNSFLLFVLTALAFTAAKGIFAASGEPVISDLRSLVLELYMGMISTALSYVLWNRLKSMMRASQGGAGSASSTRINRVDEHSAPRRGSLSGFTVRRDASHHRNCSKLWR